jgi:tetratricopeptide (TPR) repeat protein
VKNRAFDLELVNLYSKLNVWESVIKKTLNQPYASVPIFESLDIFFDDINNDLVKVMVLLQASQLPDFIASQEHFLQESRRILSITPKKHDPNYPYIEVSLLNSMGVFHGLLGDLKTCKSLFESTISRAKEIGDMRRVAGSMTNLAYLYFLDSSMTPESQLMGRGLLQESLKLSEKIGALEYTMITNLHLAEYYKNRGKSKLALPYYKKIYEIQQQRGLIEQITKIDDIFADQDLIQAMDSIKNKVESPQI